MKTADKTCNQFIEELASAAPTPGGGGAAALVGAVGIALGNMVGSLTVGKKKYADVEGDIIVLNERAKALEAQLMALVDKDAEMFAPLAAAYRLPKDTPEEQAHKDEVMEQCLYDACSVPLEIMERLADAMDLIVKYAEKGSKMAISDAGCAMILCKAAMQAASLNVFINTKSMKNREEAETYNAKANELLFIYGMKADNIIYEVKEALNMRV